MEASGLCMFCLKHPADSECYDQGDRTKPACMQPGCKGRHAVGVHELLGGMGASVNLVAGESHEVEEDKDLYVNIVRGQQEENDGQELDNSWMELDRGESEEEVGMYCLSTCLRKDDSGLEEEFEYFHDVTPPPEEGGAEEDRWWSPEPQRLESEEEDEEANRYLASLLMGDPKNKDGNSGPAQPQAEAVAASNGWGRQDPEGELKGERRGPRVDFCGGKPPEKKKPRRRLLRKRKVRSEWEEWETARRDAWLRELLTDSSGSEPEDGHARFEESGRWIAEMTGHRDRGQCELDAGEINESVNVKSNDDITRGVYQTM